MRHEFHESTRKDQEIRDNSCNSCRAPVRFWRNVILIALAHVALIVGLIRWSVAARASTNAESIVWLGSAEDLAARENEEVPSAQRESHAVEPKPPKDRTGRGKARCNNGEERNRIALTDSEADAKTDIYAKVICNSRRQNQR